MWDHAGFDRGQLYDALFPPPGYGDWDVELYVTLGRALGGPVLELGAGTGRILCALLEAQVDAYGVDLDEQLLAHGRRKIDAAGLGPAQPRLQLGDMRKFDFSRRFSLVLVPCNTLPLLLDDNDLRATLRCAAHHLAPNGELAFDLRLFDRGPAREQWPTCHVLVDGELVQVTTFASYDRATRLYTLRHGLTAESGHTDDLRLVLRHRDPEDLAAVLDELGYQFVTPPVDERGQQVTETSQLYVARLRRT